MSKTRGKFIVFEYMDGGDPSPFIQKIESEFFPNGGMVRDREPTDGLWGGVLKHVLSEDWHTEVHWRLLVYGFLADRLDHQKKNSRIGIEKALERGDTVICDRFNLSTYAYQLPSDDYFEWLFECSRGLLIPDLTIYLNYDIETSVEHALYIMPSRQPPFSILNRKVASDERKLREEIIRTNEMYHKAISFLRNKTPRHNIETVDVHDISGSWYVIRPLIQKCLESA